jgi:hypothetical protein
VLIKQPDLIIVLIKITVAGYSNKKLTLIHKLEINKSPHHNKNGNHHNIWLQFRKCFLFPEQLVKYPDNK